MQMLTTVTRLSAVKCDICVKFGYLKVAGDNDIASFVCSTFRTGRGENRDKKFNQQNMLVLQN